MMAQWLVYILKLLSDPLLLLQLLNAQWQARLRAQVPLSVRLRGSIRIRGRGVVVLGEKVVLVGTVVPIEIIAHQGARIHVGEQSFINYGVSISAHQQITIGKRCKIGHYVFMMDNDQHDQTERTQLPQSYPIVIEDDVWVAAHVIILPGVRICRNSIVGAGSVVTKDVPPDILVAGNPAKPVRRLEPRP